MEQIHQQGRLLKVLRQKPYITFDSFPRFKETWRDSLIENAAASSDEFPDYHVRNPSSLVTSSQVRSFQLGTGASIYTQSLIPAILEAKYEIILVTCFWAPSPTLSAIKDALEQLAEARHEYIRTSDSDDQSLSPLRIRICFSSRSLFQKLFHTTSKDGYVYPPSTWSTQLGLPSQETLKAGRIDLRVKSLFFLPFSVMHPKFLIVDRERAWLPSCNVSWEAWLEGCVEITGKAVAGLVKFYRHVWDGQLEQLTTRDIPDDGSANPLNLGELELPIVPSPVSYYNTFFPGRETPTMLLPSSHHRNPRFDIFPWRDSPLPPSTPLNQAVLRLLNLAEHFIYIQTPNLTSWAVIDKLLEALKRGVNVAIVTSKRLMILEQLITAGTTTSLCVGSLIRRYKKLEAEQSRSKASVDPDIEAQRPPLGLLNIDYYCPDAESQAECKEDGTAEEPVQSHLKLTLVDGQYVVLGSGNMDRASWFTSQELGILFHSRDIASTIGEAVGNVLSGRRESVFSSTADDQLERQMSFERFLNDPVKPVSLGND
ncbi:phospholipase D/nuclease [Annulohypoxylon maeteangense]|uniref:phospholipase D/nuclease n=1 Tax=Annulohypoxylon maeteangense TaxID=1927788 RepID=UPI002008308D|nr:phospholipase D/nuclease [Annulohypoxylon maeteangense]KAI0884119.1 phospholipase D/nuclease [Annulohypoxylon maeteangense]